MTRRPPTSAEQAELIRRNRHLVAVIPLVLVTLWGVSYLSEPSWLANVLGFAGAVVLLGGGLAWVRAAAPDTMWWRHPSKTRRR